MTAAAASPYSFVMKPIAGELDVSLVGDALGPRFLQLAILEGHRAGVDPGALPSSSRTF